MFIKVWPYSEWSFINYIQDIIRKLDSCIKWTINSRSVGFKNSWNLNHEGETRLRRWSIDINLRLFYFINNVALESSVYCVIKIHWLHSEATVIFSNICTSETQGNVIYWLKIWTIFPIIKQWFISCRHQVSRWYLDKSLC